MGLFSWFKDRKKKQKENAVRQAGVNGNVADPEVRQAFYKECGELIEEAVFQSEQAKNEYGLVTAYLADIQKIEMISGNSREEIEEAAKSLLALESAKERLEKQPPSISEAQRSFLAQHEDELSETIEWLRGEEEHQRELDGKLKYLAGEKAVYVMEHEECINKNTFLKNMVLGISVGVFVFLCLFFGISHATGRDLRIPFLLTVIAGLIFAMYAMVATRRNIYNMKVADRKRNKVIEVENRIKLRYVNCTWAVEYAYEKYHTTSSIQLETMWKEYLRIKAEEERQRRNDRQREVYRNTIIRELRQHGIADAGIWVLQPQALLDDKEMVEVRHNLNVRRQKLREHIDYNVKQKEKNEMAILQFAGEHPEYLDEMKGLIERYRLLQKLN